MSKEFMGNSTPVFSNPEVPEDLSWILDADKFEERQKAVQADIARANSLGIDLPTLHRLDQEYGGELGQKKESAYEASVQDYTPADTPVEVQPVVMPVGTNDTEMKAAATAEQSNTSKTESSSEETTREVINKFSHLALPISIEDAEEEGEPDSKYFHAQQTYDKDDSLKIKIEPSIGKYGQKISRSLKLVPAKDKKFFYSEELNSQVYHNGKTDTYYVVQPVTDKILTEMLPDGGLKDGELIVAQITDYFKNSIIESDSLALDQVPATKNEKQLEEADAPSQATAEFIAPEAPAAAIQDAATEMIPAVDDIDTFADQEATAPAAAIPVGRPETQDFTVSNSDAAETQKQDTVESKDTDSEAETDQSSGETKDEADNSQPATQGENGGKTPEHEDPKRSRQVKKAGEATAKLSLKERLGGYRTRTKVGALVAGLGLLGTAGLGGYKLLQPSEAEVNAQNELISNIETLNYEVGVDGVNGLLKTEVGGVESPTINYLQGELAGKIDKDVTRTNFAASWAEYVQAKNADLPDDEQKSTVAPDSFSADSATIELTYDAKGDLVQGIDQEAGTVDIDLDELEVSLDATIPDGVAHAVPVSEKVGVDDADREAYNAAIKEQKDEMDAAATKLAEPSVSGAVIEVRRDELTQVVKEQISQSAAADGLEVEFTGSPQLVLGEDDAQTVADPKNPIKSVDSISIEDSTLVSDKDTAKEDK